MKYLLVGLCVYLCFFSAAVNAVINLDDDAPALVYASENLGNTKTGLEVSASSDQLNIATKFGFSPTGNGFYVRYDWSNARFNATVSIANSVDFSSSLVSGGNQGDQFALFLINGNATVSQDTVIQLVLDSVEVANVDRQISMTYTLYENATDAVNKVSAIVSKQQQVLRFQAGLINEYVTGHEVYADILTGFTQFEDSFRSPSTFTLGDSARELASIGKFTPLVSAGNLLNISSSNPISSFAELLVGQDVATLTASISGNFEQSKVFLSQDDNCATEGVVLTNTDVALQSLIDYPVLCARILTNQIIQPSRYLLDIGLGLSPQILGEIEYNSARIDLPYMTTFSEYRQRLFIVNHTESPIRYYTTVTTELGETIVTLSDRATGTLEPQKTFKINTSDLFSLDAGTVTRASARIYVDARKTDVSAAIQILSVGSSQPPLTNVLEVKER